jgi:hypothetical protein
LQNPGAWAGSVIKTSKDGTFVFTLQGKWVKAESQVREVKAMLEKDSGMMNCKWLQQLRGFLQYVTQMYTSLTSYRIRFHMTIDSWQKGCNPKVGISPLYDGPMKTSRMEIGGVSKNLPLKRPPVW